MSNRVMALHHSCKFIQRNIFQMHSQKNEGKSIYYKITWNLRTLIQMMNTAVVLTAMPSNMKRSLFGRYLLNTLSNTSKLPMWEIYWDTLSTKIFSFSTTFLKVKNDGKSVLSHFRSWSSCPYSHLINN